MVDTGKKKVFISYSTKDVTLANVVRNELTAMSLNVWFDSYVIQPGQHISTQIAEGMNATDYVVVLISENSNQSDWVKREISLAFDLSQKKGLSIIPFLIDKAEVPLEFRGLLYIDGTKSIKVGLERLTDFFKAQASKVGALEPRSMIRKSMDDNTLRWMQCQDGLRDLELNELRFLLAQRCTIEDLKVLWFDLFQRRMDDEVSIHSTALSSVEIVDRSRREDLLADLIDKICRNHPRFNVKKA